MVFRPAARHANGVLNGLRRSTCERYLQTQAPRSEAAVREARDASATNVPLPAYHLDERRPLETEAPALAFIDVGQCLFLAFDAHIVTLMLAPSPARSGRRL